MAEIRKGKKVCLITPGHISSNPRLVKEAIALSQAGYIVHLVFTQYVDYLVDHDNLILKNHPEWTYNSLDWTNNTFTSKLNRLVSRIRQAASNNTAVKLNRNYSWQLKKALASKADLYIAHNLSALPIAVHAGKKNNAKCGFDAEDFHRNEVSDNAADADVKLKTAIEEEYLPQVNYVTASSPQIADLYASLFDHRVTTILNVFAKTAPHKIINNTTEPLQLFWFSQTIGPNRGLETIIVAINNTDLKMDLHLLGKISDEYKQLLTDSKSNKWEIHFHAPLYPDDIFKLAAKFDIGFTSEPGFCLNNKMALSNKLFTYIQSGLAVVTSNTIAQDAFLKQHPETGSLYNNAEELAKILIGYNDDRGSLYQTKQTCFKLGQTVLNWESEKLKFLDVIQHNLS